MSRFGTWSTWRRWAFPAEKENPLISDSADLHDLELGVRKLLDERDINAVLVRYCRGVDRCDEALIRSCYHEDGTDEHGPFQGTGTEFATFVVKTLTAIFDATTHILGNVSIAIHDDTATVESYVTATHRRALEGGRVELTTVGGRYLDGFERRAGVWLIARRVSVIDWSRVDDVERTFPDAGYRQGARGVDDPSYGAL